MPTTPLVILSLCLALGQQPAVPPSATMPAPAAAPAPAADGPVIEDNSFLIEEAYNQDESVVQHISLFQRDWRAGTWNYAFTQEWPAPGHPRQQLSYTLVGIDAGDGAGFGDAWFNWRYQVVSGPRVAVAPRLSLVLPTGDADRGRGAGHAAIDTNLPISVRTRHVTLHTNVGATALIASGGNGPSTVVRFGEGLVFLPRSRVNVLVEVLSAHARERRVTGGTRWETEGTISPGVRWAHDVGRLQIVPGVAVPVVLARDRRAEWSVLGYLSFEHPFGKR
jgi:hypothetical protein